VKNYVKRKFFLFVIFVSAFSLTGCWDSNEPEQMVYIHGLGIDYKDDKYVVYLQIVNPSLLAKSEVAGGGTESKVVVGRGLGKTLNKAIFQVYRSSQRRIFWGHLSYLVFSEEAVKKGALKATIDLTDRYRETRYSTLMYVTREPLNQLLTAVPPLEMSTVLSKLSDPEPTYKQSSLIKPIDLRELLISLNEPPHEATIPYVRLNKNSWESDKDVIKAIQIAGGAFVTTDTLKVIFPNKKIRGLKWLNEDLSREEISINKELSKTSLLVEEIKIKKIPIIHKETIRFHLSIDITTVLSELVAQENLKSIEKRTEEILKKQIRETYLEGVKKDVDMYRLSETTYRKEPKAWKFFEKNGKIPLSKDSLQKITVNVKLVQGAKQRKYPTLE